MKWRIALFGSAVTVISSCAAAAPAPTPTPAGSASPGAPGKSWRFVVGGDSRNCGDVVMPAVAAGAAASGAQLYWHLGDFRAIFDFDEDFLAQPERAGRHVAIADYERLAWDDFIQSQIVPFAPITVFLALGNHETTTPKTRADYLQQFADWLTAPAIRDQRLKDDPKDHRLRAYYHWIQGGVDFVTLDNATPDQFDSEQLRWFDGVIARAEKNPDVRAIAVGMHAALPDSLAADHSMNDWPQGEKSGRRVYARLLAARRVKPVYIFASHSHFYMSGIFGTAEKQTAGDDLPGWIVGTTGAVRYPLPEGAARAPEKKTDIYGYLVGTVEPEGEKPGTLRLEFREIAEKDIPAETVKRFGTDFVHRCFEANRRTAAPGSPTPVPVPSATPPANTR
ncbi:MAG: metallophosphoesterase [Acidobacteriota bacterium]|nr:metallophosphoesterase [Acidobacteriota bacterium]